jgi:opacity protein-like surface antigen
MPAGVGFFQSKNNSPSFGNYGFGAAVTFNLNRIIGVEGELSSMIATSSDLQFGDLPDNVKAPNVLSYTGNVIISLPTGRSFIPYGAGGVGGLTSSSVPRWGLPVMKRS